MIIYQRSKDAAIAQQVERILGKDEVSGSNPVSSFHESNEQCDKVKKGIRVMLACKRIPFRFFIGRMPVTELKRSGGEVGTAGSVSEVEHCSECP